MDISSCFVWRSLMDEQRRPLKHRSQCLNAKMRWTKPCDRNWIHTVRSCTWETLQRGAPVMIEDSGVCYSSALLRCIRFFHDTLIPCQWPHALIARLSVISTSRCFIGTKRKWWHSSNGLSDTQSIINGNNTLCMLTWCPEGECKPIWPHRRLMVLPRRHAAMLISSEQSLLRSDYHWESFRASWRRKAEKDQHLVEKEYLFNVTQSCHHVWSISP